MLPPTQRIKKKAVPIPQQKCFQELLGSDANAMVTVDGRAYNAASIVMQHGATLGDAFNAIS